MFENFKSNELSAQASEGITGGRGRGGRRGGRRKGFGSGMSSMTTEEKAAFMAKRTEFKTALSELREGDTWSSLTRTERKAQKQTLRQSIFGTDGV